MNVGQGAPEIVTGGRDGCVKIWDVRQKERPVAVLEPEMGQNRHDCWAVAFGNPLYFFQLKKHVSYIYFFKCKGGAYNSSERLVSAGFDNGDLKIFDLKTMKVHWETNVGNGVMNDYLFLATICHLNI